MLIYTKSASTLPKAIERACAGMTPDGKKKFRHDQYLRQSAVEHMQRRLIKYMHILPLATNFDDLYDKIYMLKPKGIGHLKVFDVSMRIGAYLKIDLEQSNYCYLHRGALKGWQRMTGQRAKPYRVTINSMPAVLQSLPHYLIEDFFCEFREWLRPEFLKCVTLRAGIPQMRDVA